MKEHSQVKDVDTVLYLSEQDIAGLVRGVGLQAFSGQLVERLRDELIQFDPSQTEVPVRTGFSYSDPQPGLIEWMPLLQSRQHVLMKVVGYHPANPGHQAMPTILSTFSLFDVANGRLLAILDGALLTALRTAAASAVASLRLARQDASDIGFIGCGAQSVAHLNALNACFPIEEVFYSDVSPEAVASFPERCEPLGIAARFREVSGDLLHSVDILCVATSVAVDAGPVFADGDTRTHLHVNAIGSDLPGKIECPLGLLERALVVPDWKQQSEVEGECQQLPAGSVGPELHQLLRKPDDECANILTVFDSTGWALEDYVVTRMALELARQQNIGQKLESAATGTDPKDPFALVHAASRALRAIS